MFEFLNDIFDTSDFPARWHCGGWTAAHGWLHILSDLGVWSAYLAIPLVLIFFAMRRRELPFKSIFFLFGAFILACGTTHLMDAIIFWWPAYRLGGMLKLCTALVSWATVFALIRVAPKAFALRSPHEVEREAIARKQLQELANAMPQMVWTTGPNGTADYYNDRWFEYTGMPRECVGDESWKAILHPDDVQKCLDIWYSAVRSGDRYEIEYRMKDHKTGHYRWHLARALPVKDAAGTIVRWIGTCTDIEDQKRAEENLLHSEKQFHTLVDSIPQLAWMARPDGHIYGYNKRWYDYTGKTAEEMEGWGWQTVHDHDLLPKVLERWKASLATGEPFDMVIRLRGADGLFRSFLTRCVPLRDAEGQIVQWFGTNTDITERVRMEEELRQAHEELEERVRQRTVELMQVTEGFRLNEERYRSLVEATTAIVWNTPASGRADFDLPSWAAFTGQTQEQITGWGWLEAVHPEDRPHTESSWSQAVASRSLYQVEHRLRRHDGEYRHMLARGVPIMDKEARITEWIGVHTDVTEQKQAEAALREAKEAAEAANRAKSEFLANMSHEIRTPMNGILGMTALTLDSELTGEQRTNLGMVKTSADSLVQVINDILDFSKIEAGKLELDPTPFDLRNSLGASVKALGQRAHEKGLELLCHIGPDVPDALVGDALRLRQIVTNLVGNAIKFTRQGEVVLRVEGEQEPADTVCLHFSVRDTGMGIPANKQQVIFEAFTQADASTTRRHGGTGLGLAITSQLVALMGGRVWVESAVGTGSTFHFTVRLEKQVGAAAKLIPSRTNLEGLPVLVVDDNATHRAMLVEILTHWRMRPTAVSDGDSALVALKRAFADGEPFPLVLLDAIMPVRNGFDVARQIKRDAELNLTSIIMLSSREGGDDASRLQELGVACYLRKPITQSELFDTILTAMGAEPEETRELPNLARTRGGKRERLLRILLAEDNEVNQVLAIRALEKRGHTVVLANNGLEALAALERETVDLVLMDIQMPRMDGFAATAAIREREMTTGVHLPIVALTAHAMKGDRERCLAAGMDAYVSKPLRVEELFEAIAGVLPAARAETAPVSNPAPLPSGNERGDEAAFDPAWTLARVDGDRTLLHDLIGLFDAQAQKLLPDIRRAGERGDGKALERYAHKLKGSMGSFAAARATAAALRLEIMGRNGEFIQTAEALAALEQEVAKLREALKTFTKEGAACVS